MKKLISVLLIIVLSITLFSCGGNEAENETTVPLSDNGTQSERILNLAYSKGDSLNPFTCKTTSNLQILGLVYDSLYSLDKNYKPTPSIAFSGEIKDKTVTVTLNSVSFSDGSMMTASDVTASFTSAKESGAYSSKLANFVSAAASGTNTVVFTLTNPDPYALACLTFPIVKAGNSTDNLPVGSGRYIPHLTDGAVYLVVNTQKTGFAPAIKTILLSPVRDADTVVSSLEIGNIGFYYDDLSSGIFSRLNANNVEMGINNFVYMAFNYKSEVMSNASVRQAINLALNRNEIVSNAFQGHARAAYSPFNPDWHLLVSKDLTVTRNKEKAKELIASSGIDFSSREITLLVGSENQFKSETATLIKKQLAEAGINVNIVKIHSDEFVSALEEGNYDMYIGEIRLTPNMDLNQILGSGTVSYGINPSSRTCVRYAQLLSGKCEIMDFINAFNQDLPLIPLCYRNACVSLTNSLQGDFRSCDYDVFSGIETWSFK